VFQGDARQTQGSNTENTMQSSLEMNFAMFRQNSKYQMYISSLYQDKDSFWSEKSSKALLYEASSSFSRSY